MGTIEEPPELDWNVVQELLPADWRELADKHKLIPQNLPPHLGAKVKTIDQILRLVLYMVARNVGQQVAAAMFAAAGLLDISHVALHKWMKKLGPYLAELVAAMVVGAHAAFASERWAGYELIAVDATCVQRPGDKGTTSRVHRALRLLDLRVYEAHVTTKKVGETFRNFVPQPRQLWLGDRAYANPPGIAWVKSHQAQVLVRFNRGALPLYDARGNELDMLAKLTCRLRKPGKIGEWQVFVHPADAPCIEGRLCAVRLPPDKAQQARVRLRREQGADLTAQSLAMADFVAVFTTVPCSELSSEQVLSLYGLRWQIELDFKRDKSGTKLDLLPYFLEKTIETWIYAKLLLHQLLRKLADSSGSQAAFPPSRFADLIGPAVDRQGARTSR